jgi:hypothetical protein
VIVKIGNEIHDSYTEPIMIIMSQEDKDNIASMVEGATKYCSFPAGMPFEDAQEFMKIEKTKE